MEQCHVASQKKYSTITDNNVVSVSEYDNNLNENAWIIVESDKEKNSCYIKVNGRYYKPDIVISGISEKKIQTRREN